MPEALSRSCSDSQKLPPEARIRRSAEYRALRDSASRVHTRHFVILIQPREGASTTRLGITVTKRVGNAVARNRVKRVVREVFRRERVLFPAGCDVVVIAKTGSPLLGYAEVQAELARAHSAMARAARSRRAAEETSRC